MRWIKIKVLRDGKRIEVRALTPREFRDLFYSSRPRRTWIIDYVKYLACKILDAMLNEMGRGYVDRDELVVVVRKIEGCKLLDVGGACVSDGLLKRIACTVKGIMRYLSDARRVDRALAELSREMRRHGAIETIRRYIGVELKAERGG